ncbi:TonB-dependent siderophore receptor [Salipiger thiooxidans]|uniref:TonB-dependent siderophore receptor n=1 Tax=Salipiger thiooxidans TaxID=282683 RepID=UPI001CD70AE4|nr:TonB-dependent siderophore receptor [Salipiger thiooxidans]MCA0849793.1 TonB-dependent siderophore receptor [Salipiger thiooxidans]
MMLDPIFLPVLEDSTAPIDGYIATGSAAATKTDAPLAATPQSISVISANEIRDRAGSTLAEALSYSPSFTAQPGSFARVADRFRMRGFDVEPGTGGLLRDGMRLQVNSYDGTQEPFGFERVDVVRGAASVLYGQLSPGGMVNGVSKRPTDAPLRELGATLGSHDRKEVRADFSDSLSDRLSYRLTLLARDSDTQIDYLTDDRLYVAPSLTWELGDETSLTLLGFYQKSKTRFAAPLPYGIIDGIGDGPFILDRDTFIGEPDYDRMESDMRAIGYEFSHRFDNDVRLSVKTRYYESDLTWRYLMAQTSAVAVEEVSTTGILARQYSDRHDRSRGITHDMNLAFGLDTGALRHDLLLGYDFQDTTYESDNFRAAAPSIDLNNPSYGSDIVVDRDPARNRGGKTTMRQHGIYLQDQITFGQGWTALAGVRHDWAEQDFRHDPSGLELEQSVEHTTWRAGLVYEAANGLAPYFSYSQSFFPVPVTEYLEDASFDPTLGEQVELGLRYQPVGSDMLLSAALYQLTQDNVAARDLAGNLTQIGQQRTRGLELEAKAKLSSNLSMVASYSYTDARITRSEQSEQVGQRSEDTPYHQASLWLGYDMAGVGIEGLTVAGGVRYKGDTMASGIDGSIPGYTLLDAMLRYELSDGLDVSLNVTNLLDKEYAYCEFSSCRYGDAREISVSINHRW